MKSCQNVRTVTSGTIRVSTSESSHRQTGRGPVCCLIAKGLGPLEAGTGGPAWVGGGLGRGSIRAGQVPQHNFPTPTAMLANDTCSD